MGLAGLERGFFEKIRMISCFCCLIFPRSKEGAWGIFRGIWASLFCFKLFFSLFLGFVEKLIYNFGG